MRKYFIILASLAVAGCMVSEISEETVYVNVDYPTYTATFDDEGTKVYVDTDLKMHWNAGDEISIFKTTGNQRYSFDGADGDREGTFSLQGDPQGGSELQRAYAVYPYSDNTSINTDGVITLNLPEVQHYAENSFGLGANTVVAVTESKDSDKLYFKNLCGYLVIKLYGEGTIKSITLTGNNGEKLSGQATVAPVYGEAPALTMSESAGSSITLDCGEGVALESTPENATAFWFAVPPVTFTQGFTIEVTDGASCTTSKETSIERTIVRNVINSLQSFQINQTLNQELAVEREALIAIYNALNGDNWTHNDNWCSDKPFAEWYGITTNERGLVVSIELPENNVSGIIDPKIEDLSSLKMIYLNGNHIEGTIPSEICSLRQLRSIYLSNNAIEGSIPEDIGDLEDLENLEIAYNQLSGTIPSSICNLTKLWSIYLDNNHISGSIPDKIGNLTALKYFWANFNSLSGSIPESIGQLKNLEIIDLCWNSFTGSLPASIGNLEKLQWMVIHSCNLSGSIPNTIGNLSNLEVLRLGANKLTGTIPKEIANCKKLKWLELDNNKLSGTIPEELGSFDFNKFNPTGFRLNKNMLSGEIPSSITNQAYWVYNWANIITENMFDIEGLSIPAPVFHGVDINGNNINSTTCYHDNKIVVLAECTYWSRRYYNNLLSEIYDRYHEKGVEIIYFSKQTLGELQNYVNEFAFPGRVVCISWTEDINTFFFSDEEYFPSPDHGYNYYPGAYSGSWTVIDTQKNKVVSSSVLGLDIELSIKRILDEERDWYMSTDLTHDGETTILQQSVSDNGINLVLMGDGFSDRQIADGTYDTIMRNAMNAFFSEEPYESFKERFNVSSVNVVSMTEGYDHAGQTLGTGFGDGANVYGNDNKVIEYAKNAVSEDKLDDAVVIVMMNKDAYAGTCYMYYPEGSSDYGHGLSIAYFPTSSDTDTFNGLVSHEAGGHGFAKLADEYAYEYMGAVPDDVVNTTRSQTSSWGWWKNIDFTCDPTQVRWAQFIADSRYAAENIGCYEGAFTYWTGAWRPTENSIMRYNTGGFNAPSRYAIWYRINKLAYGDSWNGTYEDFVEYDAVNRTPAAVARRNARRNCVEKNLPPLAPPVVVGHSWRDAK